MRMYAVKDVKPDMILGKSIYLANNQLLLAAGYRITSHVIIKLVERGYRYIYIMDKDTEEIVQRGRGGDGPVPDAKAGDNKGACRQAAQRSRGIGLPVGKDGR